MPNINQILRFNTLAKFKILHSVNHLIAIYGIWYFITMGSAFEVLLCFLMFLYAGIIGVNVSLHRYYAHRSFETTPMKERLLLWSTLLTSLGSPAMWCSVHRLHHSHSDTDLDPHNPRKIGIIKTWFTIWPTLRIPKPLIKPFLRTKEQRFIHNNYFLLSGAIIVLLCLIDPKWAAILYCLPAIGCFHGASAIGVLPHFWGYRNHQIKDESRNNWVASIISLGEGWHNNHHAHPYRWKQGEKWWEIDPPAFFIKHFFKK